MRASVRNKRGKYMLDKKKREGGLYEREINESEEKAKTVTPKKKN